MKQPEQFESGNAGLIACSSDLLAALKEAICQVKEHNDDYHARTPPEMISRWEELVRMAGGDTE